MDWKSSKVVAVAVRKDWTVCVAAERKEVGLPAGTALVSEDIAKVDILYLFRFCMSVCPSVSSGGYTRVDEVGAYAGSASGL